MSNFLEIVANYKNNIFQSEVWADYQRSLGNEVFFLSCDRESDVLLVKMPVTIRDWSYLYCPKGPTCSKESWHVLKQRAAEIAKREKCLFLRVEPPVAPIKLLRKNGFMRVDKFSPLSRQMSPENTLVLDLEKSEENLLSEMKPKWRYNIKLAERKGIKVRKSTKISDLKEFHRLSEAMVSRGFHAFDLEHYQKMLENLGKKHIEMFVAELDKEILAVILVVYYGEMAIYLHGASGDNNRELMPNHLLQWTAILEAKNRGCKVYDFWGIAPEGATEHSWSGITRFKRGFGGQAVKFVGAFDLPFNKIVYNVLLSANIVRKLLKTIFRKR
jgi:lipid II:glycine glycyltransferase (peptidoglycan interpeptide bridge formation enzyme)